MCMGNVIFDAILIFINQNVILFYGKISGAGLTHASQICPCLELSFPDSPMFFNLYLTEKSHMISLRLHLCML